MKFSLLVTFILILVLTGKGEPPLVPVQVMTDGFNCKEGIIIADQVRDIVQSDTLLTSYNKTDSVYILVEITSYQDGGTAVINAGFATVSPIQQSQFDYKFRRRLVSKTLVDMKEIAANIVDKIHLIRKN